MSARLLSILGLFQRQPLPGVVDWLTANITLPREMSPGSPGRFSTSRRAYQKAILECWHPESGVRQLTVASATQVMKTTGAVLGLAYRMQHRPWPALIMGPAARWTETEIGKLRLHPLINCNPVLADLKPENSDLFTNALMQMRTMPIKIVGGDSPVQLGGMSAGIVIVDEATKTRRRNAEESPDAHPMLNAFERSKDFRNVDYFHYASSSPTTPNHPFWHFILEGSQSRFHVPCPHCGNWFPFDLPAPDELDEYFALIGKAPQADYRSLVWDAAARHESGEWNKERVAASARYICPHNGCTITETQRLDMLEQVEEKHHNPYALKQDRSYIVSSFYAHKITFAMMALKFLEAKGQLIGMEAFRNSWLSKTWEQIKVNVKEDVILRLKGDHLRRTLPRKPKFLWLGADPNGQGIGTKWVVAAVMDDLSLYVIDWGTLGNVKELLSADFLRSLRYPISGTDQTADVTAGFIDSGFDTTTVYAVCQASSRGGYAFYTPTKGGPTRHGSWWETTVSTFPGLKLIGFSDYQLKRHLYIERIAQRTGAAIVLPKDPYNGSTGLNTAANDDPDSFPALVDGLSGQKLIEINGEPAFAKVPRDHYGDALKQICLMTWAILPALPTQLFSEPTGRTYDLRLPA